MILKLWFIFSICITVISHNSLLANDSGNDSTVAGEKLNDVEIQVSCEKEEFIQGESIDILAKIKNNTQDTLIFYIKHHIKNLDTDSTFSSQSNKNIYLPSLARYYFMLDPRNYVMFSGVDFFSNSLKPGRYEYQLSCRLYGVEFSSNKINIIVNTVPDSLKEIFEELIFDLNKKYSLEFLIEQSERYKKTFYEQQFDYKLLTNSDYYNALQNKAEFNIYREKVLELNKNFILKYPNSTLSFSLFKRIMHNYAANQVLVEEIITGLKNNYPNCLLLEVLRNQPEYINKQIKHLLY